MKRNLLEQAAGFIKRQRNRQRWYKAFSVMAAVVVFVTTYALILPAITMERPAICGMEAHVHTADCYARTADGYACMADLQLHTHTDACYDEQENLVCGYADFVLHTHNEFCYDADGNLVCPLDEVTSYTVEQPVLAEEETGDAATGSALAFIMEELHGDTIEYTEPHAHSEDCYDERGGLVCGQLEVQAHQHDATCLADDARICELEEHQHTDACYETEDTAEQQPDADIEYICGMEEHTHGEACYDENGELICGLEEHQHSAECVDAVETSDLPVLGTAYAVAEALPAYYSVMSLDAALSEEIEATVPISVEEYITGAMLYYRTEDITDWTDVTDAEDIPGDADFKLVINYEGVPIDALLCAGGTMTYEMPGLLRNASTQGSINSGSEAVGTITVENGTVTLIFNTEWLTAQKTETNTVINGDFYVEAEADLSQIEDNKPGEIVIGDVTITIDFEDDIIAKYGNVNISKTVSAISEREDGDYLTYTLEVTAGVDGCPDVNVVDRFTNIQYIEQYMGVTGISTVTNDTDGPQETGGNGSVYLGAAPTTENPIPGPAGENMEAPGTLVWVIGDMEANETRTLTYQVKLKDEYTGIQTKGNLQNTANVHSQTYQRDSATATFTPKVSANISKVASAFTQNENGGGTITYTVWVQASADNSYTLDNVKIVDALDGSQGQNPTQENIRQYLSYDPASFQLYQGGSKNQNGSSGLTEIQSGTGPIFTDTDTDSKNNDSFTYYVGPLAPGESKTLTYTVNVEPGVFVAVGNEAVQIKNRARIFTDDSRKDGNYSLNAYNTNKKLNRKVWDRKLAGEKQGTERTVSMSGSVYDATGNTVTFISDPDSSFTVPAGSYRYQVVANEAGDWDLSSASMTDSLSGKYMQFVGYVQVNAYTITGGAPGSDLTDAAAIANLSARVPDKTVWVKVDGKTSFSFTPNDIGLAETYAYLLTYYAQPVNTENITQVIVDNTFSLGGEVGIGGSSYTLAGINVKASVTVEGGNSFSAQKQSWYYEPPEVESGDWSKGALYWVIQVDGAQIPGGTQFQDLTSGTTHYIRNDSLVGVYKGSLGGKHITDFYKYEDLLRENLLTTLEKDKDFSVEKENTSLKVTLKEKINLGAGESLYMIIKTEPSVLPNGVRGSKTFNNTLKSSFNGTDWIDHNVASKTLYGSENTFKELGRVFTYSGSGTITDIQGGTKQTIDTAALNGAAGTFVAWQIHVNYEGNLSGRYRIVEDIPEGMEVSYVRIWWAGSKVTAADKRPTTPQIEELDNAWTEHLVESGTNDIGNQTTYYYTNGQQVIWDVGNLIAGNEKDTYAVEYQIVCRVTDPEVLLGGQAKLFNNTVSLYTMDEGKIGSDSNGVTIQKQTLSKTGTYDPETNGGRYPFKILLNELGEDLLSDTDTITLVDELSDTLILDTTSIKVINSKTGAEVTGWTASVEGQTLKLVLPDNLPLTVTYETTVNAAPGQTVSIFNNAHWEGYTSPSGGSVKEDNFSYSTGGTVGVNTSPVVTVKKLDQYNTSAALSGAEFCLVEGNFANGTFTSTEGGLSLTGMTGADGSLIFGQESGKTLQYNTVYCLTETKAPDGYVLDSTPHYFAVAKANDDGTYQTFPDGVTVWYQSANYMYQAYNHKGEATVAKRFSDAGGSPLAKIDGTYRFGIYTSQDPASNPLQTVTITYKDGNVTPADGVAKFTNLTLGETYYIYELDDDNKPIQHNMLATVNNKNFIVTYEAGPAVTIPANGSAASTVTVTNQVCYPELPQTGGSGILSYILAGLLLMAAAAMLLYKQKQRGREEL